MPLVSADELKDFTKRIFEAVNTPSEQAKLVARRLVDANLNGLDSHGVIRIRQYMDALEAGLLNPQAKPTAEVDTPSYANVNGNRTFGQVAATFAMELAIRKAKDKGVSMVGCHNMNHIGRFADYVKMAAEQDLIGLGFCNGGSPNVAPFGARQKVLGTNPVACAVPASSGKSIVMDFASAATVEGKLRVARNKGEHIKEGLILDKDGNPSTNPNDFYDGGVILPIGGNKGSALSLMTEILAGIFPGGRCSAFEDYIEGNGVLFFVMKPDLFRKRADFNKDIELLYAAVTSAKKAKGFDKILFPGEPEEECYRKFSREGITLDDKTWETITGIGASLKVSFPTTSIKK